MNLDQALTEIIDALEYPNYGMDKKRVQATLLSFAKIWAMERVPKENATSSETVASRSFVAGFNAAIDEMKENIEKV